MMTPFDDFIYLINHVLLGEEPTIEDFILLVGTLVAFIAFILWCCFPIQPKEPGQHRQFTCKIIPNHIKAFDAAAAAAAAATVTNSSGSTDKGTGNNNSSGGPNNNTNTNTNGNNGTTGSAAHNNGGNNLSQYNGAGGGSISGSYSKNGSVAMHNYYVKSGHHCCT
ncbi:nuclear transcription factor Y subunit alpha [Drosophila nasuta]|uniref:nuclear transcription factor Y subunit alpha n=1 Tax=Drosophila nasuta TaxID=42062 RepID=UPI00295ED3F4|nr:nuclear transcription factor Y subunit alpha [Drosophila nasuta]